MWYTTRNEGRPLFILEFILEIITTELCVHFINSGETNIQTSQQEQFFVFSKKCHFNSRNKNSIDSTNKLCWLDFTFQPEGNLIKDRYRSLQRRNIIEVRRPVV